MYTASDAVKERMEFIFMKDEEMKILQKKIDNIKKEAIDLRRERQNILDEVADVMREKTELVYIKEKRLEILQKEIGNMTKEADDLRETISKTGMESAKIYGKAIKEVGDVSKNETI